MEVVSQHSILITNRLDLNIQIFKSNQVLMIRHYFFMKREDKMKKNRNIKIFSFVLCLVAMLFALGLNRTSAETPGVTVSGKLVDTISNVQVSNNEGGNLDWELEQWATFRINADFNLAGKNVKKGDTTDLTVPDALIITSDSFDIRDVNTDEVIAHATVDKDNKKLSLTYTDYVEKHSDTKGSFFYARIDFKKHPQKGEVPIEVTVNSVTKVAGKVTFKGIGDGNPRLLTKTSWVNSGNHKEVQYTISVNRNKQNIKGVTIEDHLRFTNASYVKDSIKVIKGKFSYDTGEWVFSNRVDVTDQHKVTISEDGQSFVIDLGDITDQDQYRISYNVQLNYEPVDGELLKNEATLKGKQIEIKNITNTAAVQIAGGAGVGYVYSINIHKVDDANQPLKGAKFRVVRQANNQVIGEFESDENGNIAVGKLLKDKYILTEIEAPSGHIIKKADTVVNVEDFGADHSVTKTIVNPKDKPKETKATIELDKTLTGRDLTDGEFSFELYEGANKLQTVTNKNGKVTFAPIEYTEEGEHTYTVKEVAGNTPGITYDKTDKQVTVKVKKDGDNLKADVAYPDNKTFSNTYTAPQPAKAKISASKILEGAELKNGEFNFQLLDETGKVLQTKQNAADGTVTFDDISYSSEDARKTFHYTIKEVIPESKTKGMTYDEGSIDATVTVTKDDASNTLKASVAYGDKKSFTNKLVTTSIPPTPPTVDKPELKLYSIQLHKVNQEGKALAGAVFGLFEADGTTPVANPYGEGQATATSSDEEGKKGLVTFIGLEAKDYVVKELTAPEGYQLSTDVIKVSTSELKAATNLVVDKGTVVNKPFTSIPPTPPTVDKPELKLYSIQLHKVNQEGKALVGAVFGLFEADGTTPVANPYGEGQATATSDANGLVTFTGLEAKDYVVRELTAPDGYQLSDEVIKIAASDLVASNNVVDKGNVVNKPFTSIPPTPPTVDKPELKLYNIQLHKVSEEGKGLLGAVFGLYEADGTTPVANPYGEGQATATSDENGLVTFIGFEAKDYVIKELTAPTGYQLLTNPITVSASDFTQAKDLVVDKGNVVNNKIPPYTPPYTPPTPPTTPSTPPTPSTDKPKGNQPSGKQSKEGKKQSLPSTGETVSAGFITAGLVLASAGSMLVAKKRHE